ncbi:MAG: hypothetical protein J7527_16380, partial [Chitinophagaceae bacterium]|nr:hypothetical protein [Chitinophagaceae bacterium]
MLKELSLTVFTSKMSRFVLIAGTMISGVLPAYGQKTTLTMPLGKNSRLIYDLERGSYTMICSGRQLFSKAYAAWTAGTTSCDTRLAGKVTYSSKDTITPFGKATMYRLKFAGDAAVSQLFYVFKSQNYFLTQIRLQSPDGASDYIAPLITDDLSMQGNADSRALYVPFDNDMWARYNAMPLAQADFKSSELTAIYNADNNTGFVTGSLDQTEWKTGIAIKATNANSSGVKLFAGFTDSTITHDRIAHGKVQPVNGVINS